MDIYTTARRDPSDTTPNPLQALVMPEPWVQDAACAQVDPDLFFPEGRGHHAPEAKAICSRCPVKKPCLAYALRNNEEHGVWGGASAHERIQLRPAPVKQTHCSRGHEFTEPNTRHSTYTTKDGTVRGRRLCKQCDKDGYERRKRRVS
jgi:WhiB family redox-sensing transcriptional regulator